ncbi:Fe-S cluster assembly protein HesB [Nocardioides sp. Root140]|uniref:Fe-S cluster assembly protein HesB n=2 Tax=Nocardioides TaxID=1839 RepID=UPI0006FCAD2E|nr:Fe-S cluster assembly protein HesB [Nocardioides sp. Root140]KQY64540.1 Fe-S cluster assembly protein HesB [Nocardioides sp. Root140]KQZ70464.1 Fe-S cluster assembly protein HesB [Nocardioides sp. Root151]KRF18335.1 Fe-S cluster assembly protein HesB [Nocardioides sp. Soil796]
MLTLTENASTIVKDIAAQAGDEAAGLRITSDDTPEPAFAVNAAPAPEPGDQTVEQDGATIFLDEDAAQQLDDKVLDAAVDQAGGVQFSLTVQA